MTKQDWKIVWRQLRIIRRESFKASTDMLLFGVGFTKIGDGVPDGIRYVPFEEVLFNEHP